VPQPDFVVEIDAIPLAAAAVDDSGLVVQTNAAFGELFGTQREGQPLTELVGEPSHPMLRAMLAADEAQTSETLRLADHPSATHATVTVAGTGSGDQVAFFVPRS